MSQEETLGKRGTEWTVHNYEKKRSDWDSNKQVLVEVMSLE